MHGEGEWMSTHILLVIVTSVLGLITAAILALINSWVSTRAGVDENLRTQRLQCYPALWNATAAVPRWPRAEVTRGNLVTGGNNGGTLLTTIVSVDPIYVYFEGDENAYLHYNQLAREGQRPSSRDARNPVRVGLANEQGFPHEGYMDFVDNQLDVHTGTIRARAVLENKQSLFTPGMFARVQLLGSGEYDAILIEDRAVGTDQSQSFVLVLGAENKLEYRPIQPGRIVDGLRIVRQGLKPDDVVVVSGLQRVKPGAQVKPNMTTMGAPAADSTATAAAATHSN